VRILGIDPGSRATGWAVVEIAGSRLTRVASGALRPADGALPGRLCEIFDGLAAAIERTAPDTAALESIFSARGARSALLLGHARGVALLACARAGLATAEYAPSQVKGAVVGYGAAPKDQVARMVARLLGLPALPGGDEADALAVAICHGHSARSLAATQRALARESLRPIRPRVAP